jgi:hypothetical protein
MKKTSNLLLTRQVFKAAKIKTKKKLKPFEIIKEVKTYPPGMEREVFTQTLSEGMKAAGLPANGNKKRSRKATRKKAIAKRMSVVNATLPKRVMSKKITPVKVTAKKRATVKKAIISKANAKKTGTRQPCSKKVGFFERIKKILS